MLRGDRITLWTIFITIMVLGMVVAGCATLRRWNDTQDRKSFIRDLKYRRDPKTRLCFAVLGSHGGLTVVDKKYCERKSR